MNIAVPCMVLPGPNRNDAAIVIKCTHFHGNKPFSMKIVSLVEFISNIQLRSELLKYN